MTPEQALARLQGQCSRCEQCSGQVRRKLQRWSAAQKQKGMAEFTEGEIEGIIDSLVKERFVDDARFADAYVRDKARFSKWGAVKIAYNLKRLGVDAAVIKSALQENSQFFDDGMLRELLQKKWESLDVEESVARKREKLVRFALQRGFDYGQIMKVINDFR